MWSLLGWLQAVAKLGAWFTGWLDRRRIKKYVKNELLVKQLAEMEERRRRAGSARPVGLSDDKWNRDNRDR